MSKKLHKMNRWVSLVMAMLMALSCASFMPVLADELGSATVVVESGKQHNENVVFDEAIMPDDNGVIEYQFQYTLDSAHVTAEGGDEDSQIYVNFIPADAANTNAGAREYPVLVALRSFDDSSSDMQINGSGGGMKGVPITAGNTYTITVKIMADSVQVTVADENGNMQVDTRPFIAGKGDYSEGIQAIKVRKNSYTTLAATFVFPTSIIVDNGEEEIPVAPPVVSESLTESAEWAKIVAATYVDGTAGSFTYGEPIMPDADGIIKYDFKMLPTAYSNVEWEDDSNIYMFFVPAGYTGTDGALRNQVPAQFSIFSDRRGTPNETFMLKTGASGNGANTPSFGTWETGKVYDVKMEIDTLANTYIASVWYGDVEIGNSGVRALRSSFVTPDYTNGIARVFITKAEGSALAAEFLVPTGVEEDVPAPVDGVYRIGPGMEYATIRQFAESGGAGTNAFMNTGTNALQPGDIVEVYPNIVDGVNIPYEAGWNNGNGLMVSVNGTATDPITIRGVVDAEGNRPILIRYEAEADRNNVVTLSGSYLVFENFVVDGGLLRFIDWLNGESNAATNRFGTNTTPAFSERVTLENFYSFLKKSSPLYTDTTLENYMRNTLGPMSGAARKFQVRGIFQESGNFVTVRNCLSIGSGCGMQSADVNPGSLLVENCEFAYNGMNGAGHNTYLNGDNGLYGDLVVMYRNNYVHHSISTFGFRSRVGRTILQNNFFLDNGVRHVDLICTQKDQGDFAARWYSYATANGLDPEDESDIPTSWHWYTRFAYREDHEVIGNVFVNTMDYNFGGLRIGGAMPETGAEGWMEASYGRYRFVNNTFVHLANTGVRRAAIEAQFGIESVEMYNNVFYGNSTMFAPFWDQMSLARINETLAANQGMLNDNGTAFAASASSGGEGNGNTWRYGIRQVAGANNWVSYGLTDTMMTGGGGGYYFDAIPDEWENTVVGEPGEIPFIDIANYDFRLDEDSTAFVAGVEVGSRADFLSEADYEALKAADALPKFPTYSYGLGETLEVNIWPDDYTLPTITKFMDPAEWIVAPWMDVRFPDDRVTVNGSTPPVMSGKNSISNTVGTTWNMLSRNDSTTPLIGAYIGDTSPIVPSTEVYEIGPGKTYADILAFSSAVGFGSLEPGDTVKIYPNTNNVPYQVPAGANGVNITSNGTWNAPITVTGVPDAEGNRPILVGRAAANVLCINGDYVVVENLMLDGGILEFIDFLNGNSTGAANRFPDNATPMFDAVVTLDNFADFLEVQSTNPLLTAKSWSWGFKDNTPRAFLYYEKDTVRVGSVNRPGTTATTPAGATLVNNRYYFSYRGIFHTSGDHATVRNCFSIGSGTGLTSGDVGPGSLLAEYNEFAFNGMNMAAHNVYLNGDNAKYPDMEVTFQYNYIHHAIRSFGFRSRVGQTNLYHNVFLDNDAKHVDLVATQHGYEQGPVSNYPAHWNSRFTYREDSEVVGNIFIYTENTSADHVRIGGAGPFGADRGTDEVMEQSFGRYRFVNNTFVSLGKGFGDGDINRAINAQFGIESVEMYNNIFYSANPSVMIEGDEFWTGERELEGTFAAFVDSTMTPEKVQEYLASIGTPEVWDEYDGRDENYTTGDWVFGVRQVAGANNWVSNGMVDTQMPRLTEGEVLYYYDCIPDEWTGTVIGKPGEDPFVDLANFDFRLKTNSSAAAMIGSPVGTSAQFMSEAEFDALLAAGEIPLLRDWDGADNYAYIDAYPIWHDLSFQNPLTTNATTAPIKPVSGVQGVNWTYETRTDSIAPSVGAFASDYEAPVVVPSEDANDGYYVHSAPQTAFYAMVFPFAERLDSVNENSVSFDITVNEAGDGYVSFVPEHWNVTGGNTRMAGISTNGGVFAVRDNGTYKLTDVEYELGQSYKVEFVFDFTGYKYDVYIDDVLVADDYAFLLGRTPMHNPEVNSGSNDGYGILADNIGKMTVLSMTTTAGADFDVTNINRKLTNLVDNDSTKNMSETNPVANGDGTFTYLVGPNRKFQKPQDVIPMLQPGDTLALDGGYEYPAVLHILQDYGAANGTEEAPITVKGVPDENGNLPVLVSNGALRVIDINTSWWVLENLEVRGNAAEIAELRGITQQALQERWINGRGIFLSNPSNLVIRGCEVYGSYHGIQGESQNLLIEYCDVWGNGLDVYGHNIYLMSNPDSVARIQYNYIHDTISGSSAGLKTRYGRNEVYNNYFENCGRAFEGIQIDNNASGRDSDFVGNVIVNCRQNILTGSDDNNQGSHGRYRIANNTIINTASTSNVQIVRTVGYLESVEMYNNLIYVTGSTASLWNYENENLDGRWIAGEPRFVGANNWISNIRTVNNIPDGLVNTMRGSDPGFMDFDNGDFRLKRASELIGAGVPIDTLEVWEDYTDGNWRGGEFAPTFENPLLMLDKMPVDKNTFAVADRAIMANPEIGAYGAIDGIPVVFMNGDDVYTTLYFDENGLGAMPSVPVMDGYTFLGWFTESGEAYTTATVITEAMTVFAKWRVSPMVSISVAPKTVRKQSADFTISVVGAEELMVLSIELEMDATKLFSIADSNYISVLLGNDVIWLNKESNKPMKWVSAATEGMKKATIELGFIGNGLTSDQIVDLVSIRARGDELGDASIKITKVTATEWNSNVEYGFSDAAVTKIVASLYDINDDGALDNADLAYALRYYMEYDATDDEPASANWALAQAADVNGDGIVNMTDIMIIYNAIGK